MSKIKNFLSIIFLISSLTVFAKGGDDVGNGGFAHKQSVIILKMATGELAEKIRISTLRDIIDFPERRDILLATLSYDDLDKFSKKIVYRGDRLLAMDYAVKPATVIILKPYFDAFAGVTDSQLNDASYEVQKRLLHEASHIWGYNEDEAAKFSVEFLRNVHDSVARKTGFEINKNFCACLDGKSDIAKKCDSICSERPSTYLPILYGEVDYSSESSVIKNLYDWCSVQLSVDQTSPQCALSAKSEDGEEEIILPVSIRPGKNTFSAEISPLSINKIWTLKLIELKTGSNAQSKTINLLRVQKP